MLMLFPRALDAELLKLKRTIALKMVVLAPIVVILLAVFIASSAPHSSVRRGQSTPDDWRAFGRLVFQFWAMLMLPLYITLQSALIAGIDHADNQWKALLARPVPRASIYFAKLLIQIGMLLASSALLLAGVAVAGRSMKYLTSELRFSAPMPVEHLFVQLAQITALAFLALAIQHWVSLRWRSFPVAVGFGIVAMVTAFGMLLSAGPYGAWPQYFPWALPVLVLARHAVDLGTTVAVVLTIGVFVSLISCLDLARRDLS